MIHVALYKVRLFFAQNLPQKKSPVSKNETGPLLLEIRFVANTAYESLRNDC